MSQFTNALSAALKSAGKTQTDIANTLGINPSLVSRWANNKTDLREETLVRLLSQIPAEHHKMLIESYLLDRCPEQYRALISFAGGSAAVAEALAPYQASALPTLPERTQQAITTLTRLCESNPPLRRMLTDLAHLLTHPNASATPSDPLASDEQIHRQRALDQYHASGGTWHPGDTGGTTHTSAG